MKSPFKAGDVLLNQEGSVTKILVVDDGANALHVRLYEGDYANADAVVRAMKDAKLVWSVGHAPMAADAFDPKTHTTVTNEPVTDDELEGYRYYLEAMGEGPGAGAAKPNDEGFFAKFWKAFGGKA